MHPRLRKHLLACALLASLGAAQAQQAPAAPQGGPAAHGHHDPARRAEWVNKRLADLKQKLQVNGNQEAAWASFSAAMQPPAQPPQRPDPAAMASLSTPERIDRMRAMRAQRDAEMDKRADATKAFYAVLTPEQQKTFDAETARMFGQGRGGMRGHHHQHG